MTEIDTFKASYIDRKLTRKPAKSEISRIINYVKQGKLKHYNHVDITLEEYTNLLSEGTIITHFWRNSKNGNTSDNNYGSQNILIDLDNFENEDQMNSFLEILSSLNIPPNYKYKSASYDLSQGKAKYRIGYILDKPYYEREFHLALALFRIAFLYIEKTYFKKKKQPVDLKSFSSNQPFYSTAGCDPEIIHAGYMGLGRLFGFLGFCHKVPFVRTGCTREDNLIQFRNTASNDVSSLIVQCARSRVDNNTGIEPRYEFSFDSDFHTAGSCKHGAKVVYGTHTTETPHLHPCPSQEMPCIRALPLGQYSPKQFQYDLKKHYSKPNELADVKTNQKTPKSRKKGISPCLALEPTDKKDIYNQGYQILKQHGKDISCHYYRRLFNGGYEGLDELRNRNLIPFFSELLSLKFNPENPLSYSWFPLIRKMIYHNRHCLQYKDVGEKFEIDHKSKTGDHEVLRYLEKDYDSTRRGKCTCSACQYESLTSQFETTVMSLNKEEDTMKLEEARKEMYDKAKEIIEFFDDTPGDEKHLQVVRVDCGVGKTYSFLDHLKDRCGFVYAGREHDTVIEKLNEYLDKNPDKYKEVIYLKKFSEYFPHLDNSQKEVIEKIYSMLSLYGKFNESEFDKSINSYCEKHKIKPFLQPEDLGKIKEYQNDLDIARLPNMTVFTTHSRICLGFLEDSPKLTIMDETIFDTVIQNDTYPASYLRWAKKDFKKIFKDHSFESQIKSLFDWYLDNIENCVTRDMMNYRQFLNEETLMQKYPIHFQKFLNEFFSSRNSIECRRKGNELTQLSITSILRRLPNHLILLSDSNLDAYTDNNLFNDYTVHKFEGGKVEPKGKIVYHSDHRVTKSKLFKKDGSLNKKKIGELKKYKKDNNIDYVITYKSLNDELNENPIKTYFGNCSGRNELEGKNLCIVGDYRPTKESMKHKIKIVFGDLHPKENHPGINRGKTRLIIDGIEFSFFPYFVGYEQFEAIEVFNQLKQAIGRARILENECDVHIFSQVPPPAHLWFSLEDSTNTLEQNSKSTQGDTKASMGQCDSHQASQPVDFSFV